MSYIGFQTILKDRLLNASFIPTGINANNWTSICNKLRDEDTWDKEVADCVKRANPNNIFLINAATIAQYEAFRCIRNICAHGKTGTIDYYQIEHLWSFIQENYLKFTVNGSKAGIMQMIEDHFDPNITPVGADITYIVENIKLGIKGSELQDFLQDLFELCRDSNSTVTTFGNRWKQIELWDKLVNESSMEIQNNVISYLKDNHPENIDDFVTRYPATAESFLTDDAFVRRLWNTIIFEEWGRSIEGSWIILEKIIDRGAVPENEKATFHKNLFKFVGKSFPKQRVSTLNKTDYFTRLKSVLFDSEYYQYPNTYTNANSNATYIIGFLNEFGLDKTSVRRINSLLVDMTYGPFVREIKAYLEKREHIDKYREIISANSWTDHSINLFEDGSDTTQEEVVE